MKGRGCCVMAACLLTQQAVGNGIIYQGPPGVYRDNSPFRYGKDLSDHIHGNIHKPVRVEVSPFTQVDPAKFDLSVAIRGCEPSCAFNPMLGFIKAEAGRVFTDQIRKIPIPAHYTPEVQPVGGVAVFPTPYTRPFFDLTTQIGGCAPSCAFDPFRGFYRRDVDAATARQLQVGASALAARTREQCGVGYRLAPSSSLPAPGIEVIPMPADSSSHPAPVIEVVDMPVEVSIVGAAMKAAPPHTTVYDLGRRPTMSGGAVYGDHINGRPAYYYGVPSTPIGQHNRYNVIGDERGLGRYGLSTTLGAERGVGREFGFGTMGRVGPPGAHGVTREMDEVVDALSEVTRLGFSKDVLREVAARVSSVPHVTSAPREVMADVVAEVMAEVMAEVETVDAMMAEAEAGMNTPHTILNDVDRHRVTHPSLPAGGATAVKRDSAAAVADLQAIVDRLGGRGLDSLSHLGVIDAEQIHRILGNGYRNGYGQRGYRYGEARYGGYGGAPRGYGNGRR